MAVPTFVFFRTPCWFSTKPSLSETCWVSLCGYVCVIVCMGRNTSLRSIYILLTYAKTHRCLIKTPTLTRRQWLCNYWRLKGSWCSSWPSTKSTARTRSYPRNCNNCWITRPTLWEWCGKVDPIVVSKQLQLTCVTRNPKEVPGLNLQPANLVEK